MLQILLTTRVESLLFADMSLPIMTRYRNIGECENFLIYLYEIPAVGVVSINVKTPNSNATKQSGSRRGRLGQGSECSY